MMKKRVFIGIKADVNLQTQVAKWQKKYAGKINPRWIELKNLHITLVPPWYEDEEKLVKLTKKLKELKLGINPFGIRFDKVEFGPDFKRPRLIWAVGRKPEEVFYLEKVLTEYLKKKAQRESGFIHLTLARFNPKDFRGFACKKISDKVCWKQNVNSFSLYESRLSRLGSEYKIILSKSMQNGF